MRLSNRIDRNRQVKYHPLLVDFDESIVNNYSTFLTEYVSTHYT